MFLWMLVHHEHPALQVQSSDISRLDEEQVVACNFESPEILVHWVRCLKESPLQVVQSFSPGQSGYLQEIRGTVNR